MMTEWTKAVAGRALAGCFAVLCMASVAHADAKLMFKCPRVDAGDIEGTYFKTKLYQGLDGFFFRGDRDIQTSYAHGSDSLSGLGRLSAAFKARGAKLVYMPVADKALISTAELGPMVKIPDEYQPDFAADDFEGFLADMRRQGVLIADILEARKQLSPEGPFYFARDLHWRPQGARIGAAAIKAALANDPDYAELTKKEYASTDLHKQQPLASPMLQALQRMCADKLPQENVDLFQTEASGAAASDLLGGDDTTPVALVGTSYSDVDAFNFVGFLEEALGLEVANYAISGGGAFTSLQSYVQSGALDKAPPKYVVWENPAYNRLDEEGGTYFRQIIPAVYGACSGDTRLLEKTVHVDRAASATIAITGSPDVLGHRFYFALQASASDIRTLSLELNHEGGDGETFAIARSDRLPPSDRFFVEVSDDIPSPLRELVVKGQPDRPTDFTVDLCKEPENAP
jgi:alginate biosynthesis protein AlgX